MASIRLDAFRFTGDVGGFGTRFFDCVNHRLRVRWLGHRFGQFIDSIAEVRAVLPKFLEQRDHLGDLFLTQYGLSVNRLASSIGVAVSPSITWIQT
jgi:hypothetical protein